MVVINFAKKCVLKFKKLTRPKKENWFEILRSKDEKDFSRVSFVH